MKVHATGQKQAIILLFVACFTVTSATRAPSIRNALLDTQTIALCAYSAVATCAAFNASCATVITPTTIETPTCISGTYMSDAQQGPSCYCKAVTLLAATVGDNCTVGDTSANQLTCTKKNPTNGDDQYYWFSQKQQGDTCSSIFDCAPPRRCIDGKCYGQLITGETCYNETSTPYVFLTAACSWRDYCPSSGAARVCTARLDEGAECTDTYSCSRYMACITSTTNSSKMTCQLPRWYWIPAGQKANATQYECYASIWDNATNKTCLNYNDLYTTYQRYAGASCSSDSECSSYGSCTCTNAGTSTAAACSWSRLTHDQLVAARAVNIARAKKYYDIGCEGNFMPATADRAYCVVQLGDWSATSSVCGAMHTMATLSSMSIMVSVLIAMLASIW